MDYYKLLGVDKESTPQKIKAAYRTLAKKYHPDTYQGDKTVAENKMKEINEAYDILSDKAKREAYDIAQAYETQKQNENNNTESYYSYTEPTYYKKERNIYSKQSYSNSYSNKREYFHDKYKVNYRDFSKDRLYNIKKFIIKRLNFTIMLTLGTLLVLTIIVVLLTKSALLGLQSVKDSFSLPNKLTNQTIERNQGIPYVTLEEARKNREIQQSKEYEEFNKEFNQELKKAEQYLTEKYGNYTEEELAIELEKEWKAFLEQYNKK